MASEEAQRHPWACLLAQIRDDRSPLEFCGRLCGLDTPVSQLQWAEHVWPRLQSIWWAGLRSLDLDHAPPCTEEEILLFQLVSLYAAVVKRQCNLTYSALLRLPEADQNKLTDLFRFLLEEGEALNRQCLVEYLSIHGDGIDPISDPPSTPTTRHALRDRPRFNPSRTRTRSSPGVYASSPGGRSSGSVSSAHDSQEDGHAPSSPLKRFMQSPVTQQVSKYQEIAHQQTRLTLATKVELDQERSENAMLKEDLTSAKRELENLKESLQVARSEVYALKQIDESQELEDVISKLKDELRRKSCQHDCQLLTDQLYDAQSRCQSLEGSLTGLKRKMAEVAQKNASFETQVVNLEVGAKMKAAENERLKESLQELEKLVKDLSDTKKNDSGNGSLMSPISRRGQRRSMSFSSPENPDQSGEVVSDILVPDLEEKLAQSQRQNVELTQKLSLIQTQIMERDQMQLTLQNALTVKDEALKTLEMDKLEIQGKYEKKMQEFEQKMLQVQEERQELNEGFKTKIESMESEMNHLKSTNTDLETELGQLGKSKDNLMQEYEEFRTSSDKQLQNLNEDRQRISEELNKIQAQSEKFREEIQVKSRENEEARLHFQAQIEQLTTSNHEMSEKNQALIKDLSEKDQKIVTLEENALKVNQELNSLQESNEVYVKEIGSLQSQLQEVIMESDALKTDLSLVQEKNAGLLTEMAEKKKICEELRQKVEKLDELEEEKQTLLNKLTEIRQQNDMKVEEFHQKIQFLEHGNQEIKSNSDLKIQEILEQNESLTKEFANFKTQKTNEMDDLTGKIQSLETENQDLTKIQAEKEALLNELSEASNNKDQELKQLLQTIQSLEIENQNQREQTDLGLQDLAQLRKEKEALSNTLSETTNTKDMESKQLLQTIQSLEAKNQEIRAQFQTCSQNLDELREHKMTIEQELVNLQQENESKVQELKVTIQSLESEKEDVHEKLKSQIEAFNQVLEEKEVLVNQIQEIKNENAGLKTQMVALEALNVENENVCKKLRQDLDQVKSQKEELVADIAEIQSGKETKFQELLEKIQILEKTNLDTQSKLDSEEEQSSKIQAENLDLINQLSFIQSEKESETKELQAKIQDLEDMNNEIQQSANSNKDELLKEITNSQEESKKLTQKIESLELENQRIRSEFATQTSVLKELEIKHHELLKDHNDLLQKIQTLEKTLSDSNETKSCLAEIQSQLDESRTQIQSLEKINANLKQDLDLGQSNESEKTLEIQSLSMKLTEMSQIVSEKDQDIMTLKVTLSSEKKQLEKLQDQLTQNKLDLEQTKQKLNDVTLEHRESNEDHSMEINEIHTKHKDEIQALEQRHREALNAKVLEIEDERTKMAQVNEKLETLLESQDQLQAELRSRITNEQLQSANEDSSSKIIHELETQLNKAREDFKKLEERNTTMKAKYQNKLKEASEEINKKYTEKLDEFQKKFKAENAKLKEERNEAKARVEETLKQYHEEKEKLPSESAFKELQKKYETCKKLLVVRQNENDTLKKKLKSAPQLQSLAPPGQESTNLLRRNTIAPQVQNLAPSEQEPINPRRNTIAPQTLKPKDLPKIEVSKFGGSSESVFKCPTNTPGRCKPGRTQSEVAMGRRPPAGYGSMVLMDDEAGEMFSSSYLSDAKSGRCELNSTGGRISELSRRNSMYPAHLQSSYPAETQFYAAKQFNDDDLRSGRLSDVHNLAEKTSQMRVDSPASNTRSRTRITGNPESDINSPNPLPVTVGGRKRRSEAHQNPPNNPFASRNSVLRSSSRSSNSSMVSNDSSLNGVSALKKPKMALTTGYSKPGPPTPALKGKRGLHTSFGSHDGTMDRSNRSIAQQDKTHDKTPLLDTTNTSESSINRSSLRSRIIGTPGSLKKVMAGAFSTNRKKYNVKRPTTGNGPQENQEPFESDHV